MSSTIVSLYHANVDDCSTPRVELNNAFKGLATKVGVNGVFWSPHTSKHYFAGNVIPLLESGLEKLYKDTNTLDTNHAPVSTLITTCEKLLELCYQNKSAHLVSRINPSSKKI